MRKRFEDLLPAALPPRVMPAHEPATFSQRGSSSMRRIEYRLALRSPTSTGEGVEWKGMAAPSHFPPLMAMQMADARPRLPATLVLELVESSSESLLPLIAHTPSKGNSRCTPMSSLPDRLLTSPLSVSSPSRTQPSPFVQSSMLQTSVNMRLFFAVVFALVSFVSATALLSFEGEGPAINFLERLRHLQKTYPREDL